MSFNDTNNTHKNIERAAGVIKKGGIVIFPTDTVYGIGCRWDHPKSVEKIYQIKSRPKNLPFPILLSGLSQLNGMALVTPLARDLAKRYWPGGLTIILKLETTSLRHPERSEGSVGFRIPNNQTVQELIRQSGTPIIGTSANLHGKPSVKNSKDLDPKIVKLVDYVIEGECEEGIESTVIDATGKKPVIIRLGAIAVKSLDLTIDTVNREKILVTVADYWSNLKDKIVISQQTGSQALIPAIIKILKVNKCSVKDLTGIEVNVGPGSFTGTRVGVAVANALGFALDIPVNGSPRGGAGKLGKIAEPIYEKSKFD